MQSSLVARLGCGERPNIRVARTFGTLSRARPALPLQPNLPIQFKRGELERWRRPVDALLRRESHEYHSDRRPASRSNCPAIRGIRPSRRLRPQTHSPRSDRGKRLHRRSQQSVARRCSWSTSAKPGFGQRKAGRGGTGQRAQWSPSRRTQGRTPADGQASRCGWP